MIAQIKGTVLEATPLLVIIEANGIGYELHIPLSTAERIPAVGQQCTLFTHAVYREDSATLYGFIIRRDRDFFRLLIEKVSGIGPKIGIGILSRLSVELLQSAIANSDITLLSKCPGIGKKTAERLVIELKDKVATTHISVGSSTSGTVAAAEATPSSSNYQDAVASLIALGYKPAEADKLVRGAVGQLSATASVEELIRKALA
ncbi:MAG: Holliday junction branch migration protein RuvA [Opitutales bacterium]